MAGVWNFLKELQAKRREADERDNTVLHLAQQALKNVKVKALEIADGRVGVGRSFCQTRIEYEGSKGSNSYARRPVAEKLVELLKAEGLSDARANNCYDMVQFSW